MRDPLPRQLPVRLLLERTIRAVAEKQPKLRLRPRNAADPAPHASNRAPNRSAEVRSSEVMAPRCSLSTRPAQIRRKSQLSVSVA